MAFLIISHCMEMAVIPWQNLSQAQARKDDKEIFINKNAMDKMNNYRP